VSRFPLSALRFAQFAQFAQFALCVVVVAAPASSISTSTAISGQQLSSSRSLGRTRRHLSGSIFNPPSGIFGFHFKGSAF
jgi:hypothetical protein